MMQCGRLHHEPQIVLCHKKMNSGKIILGEVIFIADVIFYIEAYHIKPLVILPFNFY